MNTTDIPHVTTNRKKLEQEFATAITTTKKIEQAVTEISPDDPVAVRELQHVVKGHPIVFTFSLGAKLTKCIIVLNEMVGEAQKIEHTLLDFTGTLTVLVQKVLYAFKQGGPVSAYKLANFTSSENLVKTTLPTLPRNEILRGFSVCHCAGNIILTGGRKGLTNFAQTHLMDLQTDRWRQNMSPDLNKARCNHSSLGIGNQCYVACGDGDKGLLSSIEILRLGAEAWELIEIPDFAPRVNPSLAQIDT